MGRLEDSVMVGVYADNQESAFIKAKKAIQRDHYRIASIDSINPLAISQDKAKDVIFRSNNRALLQIAKAIRSLTDAS